jgi:hypothetical protein
VTVFDPVDTARRLEALLTGRRWHAADLGLLEVTTAVALRTAWPVCLRLRVECDEWPAHQLFEVEFALADTVRGATPTGNAESLAEDAMVRIERSLGGAEVPGVTATT